MGSIARFPLNIGRNWTSDENADPRLFSDGWFGKVMEIRVTKQGPIIHIRIGDPKRFVSEHQTYVITYGVENAILFFNDHDELYWNVTGNDWKAPIEEASADVRLALKSSSRDLWTAWYTGPLGRRTQCGYDTYENGGRFSCDEES